MAADAKPKTQPQRKRNVQVTALKLRNFTMLFLPVLIGSFPAASFAASVCDDLRQELRAPAQIIGNTAEVRHFASALTRQNIIIRKIRNDLRAYGCSSGSIVVYGGENAQLCDQIEDALYDAEAERDDLLVSRDQMMAQQRNRGIDRDRVMAALDANGCFDERPQSAAASPNDQTQEFAPPGMIEVDPNRQPVFTPPMQGGLRTLCVRTCDGAFFPISSNASPLDFRRQAATCEQMCPGSETELYYHSLQGQESADMVSAETGKPYKDLPTAFAYRNTSADTRSPSCGCNMASYFDQMKKQEEANQSKPAEPYSGITDIKTPNGEKKQAEQPVAEAPAERDYDPKDSKVRVVGPQFLPEETSRIDLHNPALQGAQPQQQ